MGTYWEKRSHGVFQEARVGTQ